MKKVQITHELFTELIKYHLLDVKDGAEKIQTALNEKLDALVKHELYTKYKTSDTEEGRTAARNEYLDKIGVQADFRW